MRRNLWYSSRLKAFSLISDVEPVVLAEEEVEGMRCCRAETGVSVLDWYGEADEKEDGELKSTSVPGCASNVAWLDGDVEVVGLPLLFAFSPAEPRSRPRRLPSFTALPNGNPISSSSPLLEDGDEARRRSNTVPGLWWPSRGDEKKVVLVGLRGRLEVEEEETLAALWGEDVGEGVVVLDARRRTVKWKGVLKRVLLRRRWLSEVLGAVDPLEDCCEVRRLKGGGVLTACVVLAVNGMEVKGARRGVAGGEWCVLVAILVC